MKLFLNYRRCLAVAVTLSLGISQPAWSQDAPAQALRPIQPVGGAAEPAAPPAADATAVDKAVFDYQTSLREARASGRMVGRAETGELIDKAFADLDFVAIPIGQIEKAINSVPIVFSTQTKSRLDQALQTRMRQRTPDGARAASLRLLLNPRNQDEASYEAAVGAALQHPALRDTIAAGHAGPLLSAASGLPADQFRTLAGLLNQAAERIPADASGEYFRQMSGFFLNAGRRQSSDNMKAINPFRLALIRAIDAKDADTLSEQDRSVLQSARNRLAGAMARGELVNHPAPELELLWYFNPQNEEERITSLQDLRGKVVVLDFFATWCGPCIASFPSVRELQRFYQGYDVVILGVTSIQGRHIGMTRRVDTQGRPEQEMELMKSFIEERQITWPTAFSRQSVFNPDYGITGIPSVAIIDAEGKVRHIGLHPGRPLAEKVRLINPLLQEAGKPAPAMPAAARRSAE